MSFVGRNSCRPLERVVDAEQGDCMTEKSIWHIVKDCANRIGMAKLAPHDLRRSALVCAMLQEANWSRSSFCWDISRFKRPSDTLAASSGFGRRSMIASESNQIAESPGGSGRVADNPRLIQHCVCWRRTTEAALHRRRCFQNEGLFRMKTQQCFRICAAWLALQRPKATYANRAP